MYIYITHEREFINLGKNIYKIASSINHTFNEISTKLIPRGSIIYYAHYLDDSKSFIYKQILHQLNKYTISKPEFGDEYFESDILLIIEIITETINSKIYYKYKEILKNNIYWWEN